MFVLALNHFRKSFSVKSCVWLRIENRIFRISISFDRKKKPLTRKLFYISILPLNHFQTELQTCKERERERERERDGEQEQTELQFDDHKPSSSPTHDRAVEPTSPSSSPPRDGECSVHPSTIEIAHQHPSTGEIDPHPRALIPPPWAPIHVHELRSLLHKLRSTWPTHARSLSF